MVEASPSSALLTSDPGDDEGLATAPRLLVVPCGDGAEGVPPLASWAPADWRVGLVSVDEALRRVDEADVVLLPPTVAPPIAQRFTWHLPGRVLLWSPTPRPALEARAAELGLAGTVPLDSRPAVGLALARVCAQRRARDLPHGRWRREGGRVAVEVDGIGVPIEVLRALVTAAAVEHDGVGAAHFHREVPVQVGGHEVRVEIRGALTADGRAHGTIAVAARPLDPGRDALTGLPARDAFVGQLADANRRVDGRLAVLCLDLDHLTALNDGLGHEVGDLLLRWTAARLQELLPGRPVARVGSDEFAVLLEGVRSREAVIGEVEAVLAELEASVCLGGHLVYPSAKAGLAFLDVAGRDRSADGLRDAQSALGRAKDARSTGLVVFSDEMRQRHLAAVRLDHDLRHAVATGALDVHFQPIVAVPTRELRGFEALLRWWHPERGHVPPATFVPVAERNGLILPIGRWVLGRACAAIRELHTSHPDLRDVHASVNLSPVQLRQPDLVEQVQEALETSGLEPRSLRLELTEHAVMSEAEPGLAVLHRLRALGVQILLDDFGTGYSALEYLVRLPADVLKIDRSFVDGLGVDPRRTRLVCTIVDLARSLGMALVAEGVETEEQLLWLEQLGVESAQGFLLGGPVPLASLGAPLSGTVPAAS